MATDRQRNTYEMFGRTLEFNTEHSSEYSSISAAAVEFAKVQAAYDALQDFMATQSSGESSMAVEQKSILKSAIRRRMREFSKTSRALSYTMPGLHKAFEVPPASTEADLIAKGRNFVDEGAKYETEFASYGLPKTKRIELTDLLDQLETAIAAKSEAVGDTVGATAGIDAQIDAGMQSEVILDAIMRNFYAEDEVTLAEWRTARHVKRVRSTTTDDTPTPPTP